MPADCASGFCADGVCCNRACTETCFSCAAPGAVGNCLPADVGTNPRKDCSDQGAASCGTNGVCDGAGACQKYSTGTMCKQAGCDGSTLTTAFRCDGTGTCVTTPGQSCAPFMCGTDGKCLQICANDNDCLPPNSCLNGSCGKKPVGATCGNAAECNSGFCAQGICCGTDCSGTCRSCAVPGSMGTCTNVPTGQDPLGQCADQGAATCGTDGMCDGKGACRLYASGTQCVQPACSGTTSTLAGRCDGAGACTPGMQVPCDPYACGTNGQCKSSCAVNGDCSTGNVCNGTICSKKVNGVACGANAECASGSCQQGYCCAGPCTGTCMSCGLAGTQGVCTPVPAGADPLNQCADSGAASCGTDGFCNGSGACRLYAPGNVCSMQACSGSTLTLAGRCDGNGNCTPGMNQSCAPYVCGGGSCNATCSTNADCSAGNVCTGGSCGKKPLGAACMAGTDCASGICAQGVCCQTACTGTCMSCSLTGTGGTCSTVPAGQDPLNQCADQGAAGCGTDGTCDGNGACHLYAAGTTCAAGSCTGATYTPPRTCSGAGVCQAATSIGCAPFNCGTSGSCLTACTSDTDCASPNVCNAGQCSKKPLAAACTTAAECASGLCQQGVCCSSSCTGTCRSCALTGSAGTCTLVPVGQDPLAQCTDNGASGCGTDGACDGAGGCRLYAAGTTCAGATCVGVAYTPARVCNGTGSCLAATPNTCDPYVCGPTAACLGTCASNADCNAPNTCASGSCGKKPIGATCAAAAECNSGFCEEGVCCATACAGTCRSCALAGTLGTCSAVPAGQDPLNQCADMGAASCGTDGFCDGNGGCRLQAIGTTCVASTCAGTTFTPARTCDGAGTCRTSTATNCGAYVCGTGGSCLTACATNADCVAPNVCNGGSCGKKTNGTACAAATECASGFCEQGVCCLSGCMGACRSCALAGSAGTCTLVAAGQDPLDQCADSGAMGCGTDGFCDGGGACRLYASGTACAPASCTGATYTPARTCNGTGTCQATTPQSCGAYVCDTSSCKIGCTADTDCVAPNVCVNGACGKKPTGRTCGGASECLSGFCEQGTCCATACTGTCKSCALAGTAGACSNVPAGQDPLAQCTDQGASTCGTDGLCDGAGGCRLYASGVSCGTASCTGSTLTSARACNGSGSCPAATTSSCSPYQCGTGVCKTSCTVDTDCVTSFFCIGGSCVKKGIGVACGGNTECGSGFCAQGVCCNTACTGTCQSCALTGTVGACTNVPNGQDPLNQCSDLGASTCSTDGSCNGAGACRQYAAGTQCAAASCSGTTLTPARTCNGTGTCQTVSTSSCAPYACGTGVCKTTCGSTADCASPNVCNGTSCGKVPLGGSCTLATDCNSGFCAQGVCCNSACTGLCQSCALTGTGGTCTNVPAGQDPLNQCTDAGASTCGADGFCDGAGACHLYAAGTSCAAASCTGSTLTSGRTCNGTGTCLAATTSACDPFTCGTGACKTSCTADTDCVSPNVCMGSVCTKRPNGATCTANTDCANGICAQGICCATACTATCKSCALAGTLGTCTNVGMGQDPLNQCTDAGAAGCGTDGTCNGAGACRLYQTGTTCVAASCTTPTFTPARTCNGTGTCQTVTSSSCSPYACGSGACKTSCTANADCVSPFICIGSACAPNPNVKVQYLDAFTMTPTQAIKPHFQIVSTGTAPVVLSTLTIRYWYTIDTAQTETTVCDFATLGCNNVTMTTVPVSPVRTNADSYFQVGFTSGAGNLAAGGSTGEIQVWFHKNDWSNYNQSNDYSFDATRTTYADFTKVTVYQNGTLVWGTEP